MSKKKRAGAWKGVKRMTRVTKSGKRGDIECHGGETPRPRTTQLDMFEWVSPLPSAWVFWLFNVCSLLGYNQRLRVEAELNA